MVRHLVPLRGSGHDTVRAVRVHVITIFPEYFESPLATSLVGQAQAAGIIDIEVVDVRRYADPPHYKVDDAPFGGGPGMVMKPEPLARALDRLGHTHRILMTPSGAPLGQATIDRWAAYETLTLVCGRYEGVDERVAEHLIDEEVSLGDFVMLGGEPAALAIVEAVVRLLPGVVGNPDSTSHESFRDGLLEEPQYTRPAVFRGWEVPAVLRSGDHTRIAAWRAEQRARRTRERRPDLTGED